MRILHILLRYCAFWVYHKFIYHDNKPIHWHLVAAHILFSLTGMMWIRGNVNYWMVVPLLVNCTRIELHTLSYRWNNVGYFILHLVKNIPIWLNFNWAHSLGYSGAYVISILYMDTIAWILYEIRVTTSYYQRLSYTNYLTITTLT